MVKSVVGHIIEHQRAQRKSRNPKIVAETCGEETVEQIEYHARTQNHLDDVDIERDNEKGKYQCYDCDSKADKHHADGVALIVAIHKDKPCREYLDKQQHGKLSYRGGRYAHHDIGKAYAHNKVDHHSHTCEQDAARHSLAIEHKEEREINKCRTRLTLHDDEQHGYEYHSKGKTEVLPLAYVESVGIHQFGKRQSRGKLSKLGGLQSYGAKHKPGSGTLDAMRIEYGSEQQYEHHAEYDVGKHVEIAVVEHKDYESKHDGCADPHNLHARTCVEAEQIGFAIAVAGTTHAYPSEGEQGDVDDDRPIVE